MRGFIEELRYRNVFRVAVAYAIVGWLLAQVADLLGDAFNLPEVFLQMVIVLLVLGFPVALFLAWAFELTPNGVKRARDIPSDSPKDPRSGRFLNALTIVTLAIAVAWLGWDKLNREEVDIARAIAIESSIAVLPFDDFSPEGDHAWFADGLTDEILNALARLRDIRVASRTSSFAYRESKLDVPAIAAELGVAHILEGSVRRAGDRIRVTAQLIRASDDAHLWSDTFDASSADSIDIQETIAFEIASLLATAMDSSELEKMVAAGTASVAAWEAYLRMLEIFHKDQASHDSSRNREFVKLYEEICSVDPAFAEAHVLAAGALLGWLNPSSTLSPPPDMTADAIRNLFGDAVRAAIQYARSEDVRLAAEMLLAQFDIRLADLVRLSKARVDLRPNDVTAWSDYLQALTRASRFEEGQRVALLALQQDFSDRSNMYLIYQNVARLDLDSGLAAARAALAMPNPTAADLYQSHRILLYADLVDQAAVVARRFASVAPESENLLMLQIRQACAEGRVDEAEALFERLGSQQMPDSNLRWLALKTLGRDDEARELLRPLDQPDTLFALSGALVYTHFDPRPYPNLSAALEAQDAQRDAVTEISFACRH